MKKPKIQSSFKLDEITRERLRQMSEKYDMSQGQLIEMMVAAIHFKEHDRLYRTLEERL